MIREWIENCSYEWNLHLRHVSRRKYSENSFSIYLSSESSRTKQIRIRQQTCRALRAAWRATETPRMPETFLVIVVKIARRAEVYVPSV